MTAPRQKAPSSRKWFPWVRRVRMPLLLVGAAAAYVRVLIAVHRVGREAARLGEADDAAAAGGIPAGRAAKFRSDDDDNCLDPSGPVPVILLSRGRSGTGSTWQILGSLTGRETPSDEYTGANPQKSEAFFHNVGPNDGGAWVLDVMCHYQRTYGGRRRRKSDGAEKAKVVGFKWKPFRETFFSPAARHGLERIASLARRDDDGEDLSGGSSGSVKVVRSRRNPLDVLISQTKYVSSRERRRSEVEATAEATAATHQLAPHCMRGDDECLRAQLEAGSAVHLRADAVVTALREATALEDDVDEELRRLGVPFVATSFERTHSGGDDAVQEWMRIFRFLGVGPTEGLTAQALEGAMRHVSTSHKWHNETIANYEDVRGALLGTEFENLLH